MALLLNRNIEPLQERVVIGILGTRSLRLALANRRSNINLLEVIQALHNLWLTGRRRLLLLFLITSQIK